MQRKGSVTRLATPIKALAQRFAFLLLVAASFALMMIGKADVLVLDRIKAAATDVVAPVLDVLSRPAASVAALIDHMRELSEIKAENDRLKEENDRLLQWQHVARRLDSENAALKKLLHFAPGPVVSFVTARVIGDTGGAFVRSLLISAGARDGVRKGQAVLTGDGLVGRIASVGERSARILLITDLNSRVPVVLESSREKAVLAGDNSDQPLLIHLAGSMQVNPGDRVVTSGHAAAFPPGLPVGIVASADETGIRVQPYVPWSRLEYVRVVDYGTTGILNAGDAAQPKGP
jgi:rod shape-determining protein MreC